MATLILERPSAVVALCAVVVVTAFVVRGDLRVKGGRAGSDAPIPTIVRVNRPVPERPVDSVVIAGRVVDARGYPVVGASVHRVGGTAATTGSDGRFELFAAPTPFADLQVRGAGHSTRWLRASLSSPDPLVVQLEPEAPWDVEPDAVAAPRLTGEGTVRGRDGAPLVGAFVTAAGSGLWSRTDEIGRYTLPLYGPRATLLVHGDPSWVGRSDPLTLERDHGVVPLPELVVDAGSAIRGTVRDTTGNPVEGVPISIRGEGMARLCLSTTSGRFQLGGLSPGRYEVRPLAWAGAVGRAQQLVLEEAVVECALQLEPLQARKLQICREDGSPVGNAYVAVMLAGSRRDVARADGAGWAEVSLSAEAAEFEVRGEDGASEFAVRSIDDAQSRLVVAAP